MREQPSCRICKSSVRMRAIVHHVSLVIFGESIALPDFPERKDIVGIGLSDWPKYARPLQKKLNYTNTFYHKQPLLDITSVADSLTKTTDFIISSDVFEHVTPPVSQAFTGAHKLLKKGGSLILTVPFMLEENETREHFPRLFDYKIVRKDLRSYKLINRRQDGSLEEFNDLIFHGGPGSTLEMRLFAKAALVKELQNAGFSSIRFAEEPVPEFGIYWPEPWSTPMIAIA
jgi:hypothetical protein